MRITLGFVLRAHGIKGMVRVRTDGDAVLSLKTIFVGEREMKIVHAQREKSEFLLELEGVHDRNGAEALKGQPISADRDLLPAAKDDEIYLSDLVGCSVYDLTGKLLGEVVAVESTGRQDLLSVRGERTWQLPFVEGLVTSVDVAAKKIVCDPPEGLIDL